MNAKEIKKIIADHVFCADTDAHRVLGIGDAATAIEKHIATLEAANAELKRKGDKLAAFLGEIEMNARGRCVDLEQANWKLEQIQKRAYLALDGKLE